MDSKDEQSKKTDPGDRIRQLGRRWSGRGGSFSAFGTAGMMGFHLLAGMLVGGFIGYWLDEWLDTSPWLKIVFFVFGIAAGFRNIYQDAQQLMREQADKDQEWKGVAKKDAPGPDKED